MLSLSSFGGQEHFWQGALTGQLFSVTSVYPYPYSGTSSQVSFTMQLYTSRAVLIPLKIEWSIKKPENLNLLTSLKHHVNNHYCSNCRPLLQMGISGTRVCRVTYKHLPQPLRIHIQSFGTLGQILKFSKKNNLKT